MLRGTGTDSRFEGDAAFMAG